MRVHEVIELPANERWLLVQPEDVEAATASVVSLPHRKDSKLHCLEAEFSFAHGKQGDSVNTKGSIPALLAGTFVFAMGGVDTPDAPAAANGTVHFGQMFLVQEEPGSEHTRTHGAYTKSTTYIAYITIKHVDPGAAATAAPVLPDARAGCRAPKVVKGGRPSPRLSAPPARKLEVQMQSKQLGYTHVLRDLKNITALRSATAAEKALVQSKFYKDTIPGGLYLSQAPANVKAEAYFSSLLELNNKKRAADLVNGYCARTQMLIVKPDFVSEAVRPKANDMADRYQRAFKVAAVYMAHHYLELPGKMPSAPDMDLMGVDLPSSVQELLRGSGDGSDGSKSDDEVQFAPAPSPKAGSAAPKGTPAGSAAPKGTPAGSAAPNATPAGSARKRKVPGSSEAAASSKKKARAKAAVGKRAEKKEADEKKDAAAKEAAAAMLEENTQLKSKNERLEKNVDFLTGRKKALADDYTALKTAHRDLWHAYTSLASIAQKVEGTARTHMSRHLHPTIFDVLSSIPEVYRKGVQKGHQTPPARKA